MGDCLYFPEHLFHVLKSLAVVQSILYIKAADLLAVADHVVYHVTTSLIKILLEVFVRQTLAMAGFVASHFTDSVVDMLFAFGSQQEGNCLKWSRV